MLRGLFLNEAPVGDRPRETISEPTEGDLGGQQRADPASGAQAGAKAAQDVARDAASTASATTGDVGDATDGDKAAQDVASDADSLAGDPPDAGEGITDDEGELSVDPGGAGGPADPGGQAPVDPDAPRKARLLDDYQKLLSVSEELMEAVDSMQTSDYTERERQVYADLKFELSDTIDKISYVLQNEFMNLSYPKLLYVFATLKTSVKVVSGILKKLVASP